MGRLHGSEEICGEHGQCERGEAIGFGGRPAGDPPVAGRRLGERRPDGTRQVDAPGWLTEKVRGTVMDRHREAGAGGVPRHRVFVVRVVREVREIRPQQRCDPDRARRDVAEQAGAGAVRLQLLGGDERAQHGSGEGVPGEFGDQQAGVHRIGAAPAVLLAQAQPEPARVGHPGPVRGARLRCCHVCRPAAEPPVSGYIGGQLAARVTERSLLGVQLNRHSGVHCVPPGHGMLVSSCSASPVRHARWL
jgi:hypothetical protein